ncbi:hypothetical protein G9A89_000771 [Geosiphon pyriformis]|nr:hypothetical protein G9A89_000771 [Geosiphon pyriformis]
MADEATKTPIGEIDDLPIKINGIIVPIKLFKTNATLDWNTQELQLSQNGQHTRVPATCGHFKATNTTALLIDFKEEKPKPTWEAYQVLWTDKEHNELPPILSWDDNRKEKQTNELTWETDNLTWIDNKHEEISSWEWNEDKEKGKKKEERMPPTATIYNSYNPTTIQLSMVKTCMCQLCSTVIHAYSNALDDQRGKENGITNLVSLVERFC